MGHLLLGLVDIGAGVIALAWPGPTALVLVLLVGAWAMIAGLVEIYAGFEAGEPAGTRALFFVSGLVSIAFGIVLFARPGIGAVTLALLFGLFNLVYGIWALVQGIDLRRAHRTVDSLVDEQSAAARAASVSHVVVLSTDQGSHPGGSARASAERNRRGETRLRRREKEDDVSSVSASTKGGPTRLDRRKARTRQALIDAAVRLIAEGRGERASIQEITEDADIGFGSFYNHFESKDQLFETASTEVLERWGRMIDRASAGITDPAEVFSISLRLSARLSWTHPEVARFITGAGLDLLDAPGGLAPRALRDIQAGQAAGQFSVADAEVALSAVAGGLIGLLRLHQRHPERVEESSVDELAEACLRLLGLPAAKARRLAGLPLPATEPW